MSDTPRTDAMEIDLRLTYDYVAFVNSARELERELERENAALRKLLDTHILRSDLFSYLAWLEDHRDHGDFELEGSKYLVLASDGTTCWGTTFMEAVQIAEQHDRRLFDAARAEEGQSWGIDEIIRQHLREGGTPT